MTVHINTDRISSAYAELTGDRPTGMRRSRLAGKSARLLRRGDRVALRDLDPGCSIVHGTAVVDEINSFAGDTIAVRTIAHGSFRVGGSRLLLACPRNA